MILQAQSTHKVYTPLRYGGVMCRGLWGKSYFYTYSLGAHVEDIKIILLNNDRVYILPGLTLHLFFQTS